MKDTLELPPPMPHTVQVQSMKYEGHPRAATAHATHSTPCFWPSVPSMPSELPHAAALLSMIFSTLVPICFSPYTLIESIIESIIPSELPHAATSGNRTAGGGMGNRTAGGGMGNRTAGGGMGNRTAGGGMGTGSCVGRPTRRARTRSAVTVLCVP